jgi:hypothetical protein
LLLDPLSEAPEKAGCEIRASYLLSIPFHLVTETLQKPGLGLVSSGGLLPPAVATLLINGIRVAVHLRKSSNAFPSFWNVSSKRSTSGDIFCQSKSKE